MQLSREKSIQEENKNIFRHFMLSKLQSFLEKSKGILFATYLVWKWISCSWFRKENSIHQENMFDPSCHQKFSPSLRNPKSILFATSNTWHDTESCAVQKRKQHSGRKTFSVLPCQNFHLSLRNAKASHLLAVTPDMILNLLLQFGRGKHIQEENMFGPSCHQNFSPSLRYPKASCLLLPITPNMIFHNSETFRNWL